MKHDLLVLILQLFGCISFIGQNSDKRRAYEALELISLMQSSPTFSAADLINRFFDNRKFLLNQKNNFNKTFSITCTGDIFDLTQLFIITNVIVLAYIKHTDLRLVLI
jgi:hypothetical protein